MSQQAVFLYLSGSGTKPTHSALGGSAQHWCPAGSGEEGEEGGRGEE